MEQNETSGKQLTVVKPYKDVTFDHYLTYRAIGGLLTDDDGRVHKMALEEFCATYGVSRTTIWRWKQIPDLDEMIEERRNKIIPLARVTTAWNQLYLLGMQTQDKRAAVDALKTYLGHYGKLEMPVQREVIKHEGESWVQFVANKQREIVEGEVVESQDSHA